MDPFNFREFFDQIQDKEANWRLAIQVIESRTLSVLYEDKEDWVKFKAKVEELPWEEREYNIADFAQEVRDWAGKLNPRTAAQEFKERVQRKMKGTYGEVAVDMNSGFGLNTKVKSKIHPKIYDKSFFQVNLLNGDIIFELDGIANYCKKLTLIDIKEAAREFIENYDGNIKNVNNNSEWLRLEKAESIKGSTQAWELDRGPYSIKYGALLNYGIEWDLEKGLRPQCESLGQSHIKLFIPST